VWAKVGLDGRTFSRCRLGIGPENSAPLDIQTAHSCVYSPCVPTTTFPQLAKLALVVWLFFLDSNIILDIVFPFSVRFPDNGFELGFASPCGADKDGDKVRILPHKSFVGSILLRKSAFAAHTT